MVVQHNLTAMNANRYLGINNNKLSKSLEKLSSGYKINRAGDDAAGLAVSEKMRSQIAGMTQAVKNAQAGISMVQTYEGALTETDSILQRMKVLANQMSNGSYDNEVDRNAANLEFKQLNDELNQIADTDYNGVVVLNGGRMADDNHNAPNTSTLPDVGKTDAEPINTDILYSGKGISAKLASNAADGDAAESVTVGGIVIELDDDGSNTGVTTVDKAGNAYAATDVGYKKIEADSVVKDISTDTGLSGSVKVTEVVAREDANVEINGVAMKSQFTLNGKTFYTSGAVGAAPGKYYDDQGVEVTLANIQTMLQADVGATATSGVAVGAPAAAGNVGITLIQTYDLSLYNGAKATEDVVVSESDSMKNGRRNLTYADSITLQVGARSKDAVNFTFKYTCDGMGDLKADLDCSARGLGTDQLSIATQEDANYAIDQIDNAINKVSMVRGTFGAIQNRLEHKIDNLNVSVENLTDAESKIRDTNMAEEMMAFTKNQILAQASQSMLAQANQLPQSVLSLLQ